MPKKTNMVISPQDLKRLGFRPKKKSPTEYEVHVEIERMNYISISIIKTGEAFQFSGLEVEGEKANEIRKKELKVFSMEEIINFLKHY